MKLTPNDMLVLKALAQYHVLSAAMIQRLCFPQRKDRRHTRRRLSELARASYVRKSAVNVAFSTGNAGPAYSPATRGCEALAVYFNDDTWLATNTKQPRLDRLHHWLDIAWAHSVVRRACEATNGAVELVQWINEWQPCLDADGNASGYVLHTQFREQPPLSCSPDAGMLLKVGEHQRVFMVEIDRGTSGATRVAASKMPGYATMAATQAHRRAFPGTTFSDFGVLIVTVTPNHRDRLQREVAKKSDDRPDLWLFTAREDFESQRILFDSILRDYQGNIASLMKRPPTEGRNREENTDAA